ncbi:MAG TPA: hypothetical protein VK716_00355 [Terracidiphilus sp.]|jgi:hypothetical protein|nr:hypothetical protein [Terracidiphilus sp.]
MRRCFCFLFFLLSFSYGLRANAQSFDLAGPKVDIHVKRGQVTLPIGQVPSLLPGDRLWIHPDFPDSQSARYILIVAFLRGATNPPPNEWFTRVETWTRAAREEGVFVVVPAEAQQALVFLAPETGGDFNTLRNAVRGRPGMFVRASQDLQSASWDRMRLDAFLDEVKETSQTDPKSLKIRVEAAARSLGIKVNQECFDRPVDQQATCLSAHTEGLVMDDSNAQTRVAQLTAGSTADLMNQLSYSNVAGAGAYSPYVGAIVDTARILASLHTAHYQYIPALALSTEDTLNLRLSVPPSFRDPKSVVVVALPPVGPAVMPPLHPVDPSETFCAQRPDLVLPAEGAPLVLATQLAHGLKLHVETKGGAIDVPLKAEPAEGGLALIPPVPSFPMEDVRGTVRGKWGFDDWEGPTYRLFSPQPGRWRVAPGDQSALVVGREDSVHLQGANSLCIEKVVEVPEKGDSLPLTWKPQPPDQFVVSMPMSQASPGTIKIEVHQYGLEKPDALSLQAYAEAASLDRLAFNAGDAQAVLTGTRLDEVAKAKLEGVTWTPAGLNRVQDADQLTLNADTSTANLTPGKAYAASVSLRDGRELKTYVSVRPPRPQVTLLSKGTQDGTTEPAGPLAFGSVDDLPVEKRLVFFLKSKVPAVFPRDEKIEVSAVDGSFHASLSVADGSLVLEDANTALGVVEPLARFGPSAFGPLQARAVAPDGTAGEWLALGTLVRMPGFKELRCPHALSKPCLLTGSNLFLTESFASTPGFDSPVDVPADFTGTELAVPHPTGGSLYLKLRDDPATVQTLTLPITFVAASTLGTAKNMMLQPTAPHATDKQEEEPTLSNEVPNTPAPAPVGVHP